MVNITQSGKYKFNQVNDILGWTVSRGVALYCGIKMTAKLGHYISSEEAFGGSQAFLVYQVTEVSLVIHNNPTFFI